jgi:Ca-activated chloride channel family protein
MLLLALAAVALILAAARPQRTVAEPLDAGAIMLVNDVSASMVATDVAPSRLAAAQSAARRFVTGVPSTIEVGLLEFARHPVLLQTPSSDHRLAEDALSRLHTSGGTAMGDAILASLHVLAGMRTPAGKHIPGAIVLLSDGASNVGASPLAAARQAATQHVPIYTIALGTASGHISVKRSGQMVQVAVPPSPQELADVARLSGGRAFTASDLGGLTGVYAHLAARLGHRRVKQEMTAGFAGGGLALLLAGSVLSLAWFGRLV